MWTVVQMTNNATCVIKGLTPVPHGIYEYEIITILSCGLYDCGKTNNYLAFWDKDLAFLFFCLAINSSKSTTKTNEGISGNLKFYLFQNMPFVLP